jgi:hypothetical protein
MSGVAACVRGFGKSKVILTTSVRFVISRSNDVHVVHGTTEQTGSALVVPISFRVVGRGVEKEGE